MAHRLLGASLFAALTAGPALAQNAGSSAASAAVERSAVGNRGDRAVSQGKPADNAHRDHGDHFTDDRRSQHDQCRRRGRRCAEHDLAERVDGLRSLDGCLYSRHRAVRPRPGARARRRHLRGRCLLRDAYGLGARPPGPSTGGGAARSAGYAGGNELHRRIGQAVLDEARRRGWDLARCPLRQPQSHRGARQQRFRRGARSVLRAHCRGVQPPGRLRERVRFRMFPSELHRHAGQSDDGRTRRAAGHLLHSSRIRDARGQLPQESGGRHRLPRTALVGALAAQRFAGNQCFRRYHAAGSGERGDHAAVCEQADHHDSGDQHGDGRDRLSALQLRPGSVDPFAEIATRATRASPCRRLRVASRSPQRPPALRRIYCRPSRRTPRRMPQPCSAGAPH